MLRTLVVFWSIFAGIFAAICIVAAQPVLSSVVERSAYSLLVAFGLYVSWGLSNFVWRNAKVLPKEKVSITR